MAPMAPILMNVTHSNSHPFDWPRANMHIARLSPEHGCPQPGPDRRRTTHDIAASVADALDRLCATTHRDEWNVFLLDVRQQGPGEYLARVGIYGPINGELAIVARPIAGDNGVPSTVTQEVAAWIAKYDPRRSPARPIRTQAARGSRAYGSC